MERTTDPGPRPLSQQQRVYQALLRGDTPLPAAEEPVLATPGRKVRHRRDRNTGRRRVHVNRRRPDYLGAILKGAIGFLVVESLVALLFSPRLAVRQIMVEGAQQIPAARVLREAALAKGQNLFRLNTDAIRNRVAKEPTFEAVTVHRLWPNRIAIRVKERQPWAVVSTPEGAYFTIDRGMVPFRKTVEPEAKLPRLVLSHGVEAAAGKVSLIRLGKPMNAPGLRDVRTCLEWAGQQKDFPLDSVAIDPTGKLCLNRIGGTQIRLGSATDLRQKLTALGLLMQRWDIREAAYVNLYAYDAPAVMPRTAVHTAAVPTDRQTQAATLSSSASVD